MAKKLKPGNVSLMSFNYTELSMMAKALEFAKSAHIVLDGIAELNDKERFRKLTAYVHLLSRIRAQMKYILLNTCEQVKTRRKKR